MSQPLSTWIMSQPLRVRRALPRLRIRTLSLAAFALGALVLTSGCVASRPAISSVEYIEIDNPMSDGSPENAKIWVPRSSLGKGVPRGRDLVRKGYEAVVPQDAVATPPIGPRIRLFLAEEGAAHLTASLEKLLIRRCLLRSTAVSPSDDTSKNTYRKGVLESVAARPGGGPVLFFSAPAGGKPGSRLLAELYDTRGPALIRSFSVEVGIPGGGEKPEDTLGLAMESLASAVINSLEWFPWYGKVVAVKGDRVYLDVGAESGLKPGQRLLIFRGGEVVQGIGFVPGETVSSLTVKVLVGPDSAYGNLPEAGKVRPGDYVELVK